MRGFLISLFIMMVSPVAYGDSIQKLQTELQQKKYAHAATTGLSLLRQDADNIQLLFLTAVAFQHNKQPEQAARYYREIVNKQPHLPEPLNNLAMIQLQQGKHDEAVDLLIASLNTHPAYATAWQNLSSLYRGLASEAYRKALSEENDTSEVVDKIQLLALNDLHSMPQPEAATTVAAATATEPARNKQQPVSINISPAGSNAPKAPGDKKPLVTDAELVTLIQQWAAAWSSKDFNNYINAYSSKFKGRKGSRSAWVTHRRSRIVRPGNISVKVDRIQVKSRSANRAIVDFHQTFKSPTYRDKVVKRIVLSKIDDRWLITRETTLSVL